MKFLGDVPIGRATIELLRQAGHDVVRAVDRLPPTATDGELVQLAVRDERVILCFDLDFGAIVAKSGHARPSVITFRTTRRHPAFINERLKEVLAQIEADLPRGVLVTIEDWRVRVRPLPVVRRD
jgi:predicted nuclease of predicted toxin-antitoxin system